MWEIQSRSFWKGTLALLGLLSLFFQKIDAQPTNDNPCSAIYLDPLAWNDVCTPGNAIATNNIGATDSGITPPSCGTYSNNDVWFTTTLPNNGFHIEVEFSSGTVNPEYGYEVFVGSACGSLTSIDCQVSSGGSNLIIEDGCHFEYSGEQVWIRFWDENGEAGSIDVCAKYRIPNYNPALGDCPPNFHAADACCDAVILSDELDGFCGNNGNFAAGPNVVGPPIFNAVIENNSWLAFTAVEDSVVIDITSSSCTIGTGLQALIF
ncbi:MAG: hypothetical protein HKN16_02750, partial [Saprospiraceae bacterium]|nr:hypothetical protein [Saprospiraceae bacterium]